MTISDVERPDLIASVRVDDRELSVALTDGRNPHRAALVDPRLLRATRAQPERVEIGRFGILWPEIDEDFDLRRPAPRRRSAGRDTA